MTPRLRADAPILTSPTPLIALTAIPLLAAARIDPREFLGAPVWQKPLQFHLALGVCAVTLAFFRRSLPQRMTQRNQRIVQAWFRPGFWRNWSGSAGRQALPPQHILTPMT